MRAATSRLSALGATIAALVAVACSLAWRAGSGLVPRDGGLAEPRSERLFLVLFALAFATYVAALLASRRTTLRLRAAIAIAIVVQALPLAAPVLLSTDAWTYWGYGWIAARDDANPYRDEPASVPGSPALPHLGAAWRGTTTVYGPAFTGVSEVAAIAAGESPEAAAWIFKLLAAIATLGAAILAARLAARPVLAVVAVGWSPILAIHGAGGGHNDAWVGALVLGALAAGAARPRLEGLLWTLAVAVKWVPLALLPLRLLAERRRALVTSIAVAAIAVGAVAVMLYGVAWLGAITPIARNAATKTAYSLPSRLEQVGLGSAAALGLAAAVFGVGYLALLRSAARGRARHGLAACLALVTTPYLAVWYLGWAVPLAAVDDDDAVPLVVVTVLGAYLLPQTVPR